MQFGKDADLWPKHKMIKKKKSVSEVTCGQVWWPILGICALHLTHPKCTHTAVNTHTPWTHTRSSGQPFMLRRPGSSWGFGDLLKGTSVVVLRMERALYIHSPHLQFLPARDLNSQPFDYESDSLTIRPKTSPFLSAVLLYLIIKMPQPFPSLSFFQNSMKLLK